VAPNEGLSPTDMAHLGPAAIALCSQGYGGGLFLGHPWAVGEGWSTSSGGQSVAYKVESVCQYAGVQGLRGVMRQNHKIVMDMCISPNVGP
jgi:hypothetical protein